MSPDGSYPANVNKRSMRAPEADAFTEVREDGSMKRDPANARFCRVALNEALCKCDLPELVSHLETSMATHGSLTKRRGVMISLVSRGVVAIRPILSIPLTLPFLFNFSLVTF
jgi:hypothetical protein